MTPATPLTPSQIRKQIGRAYWLLVLLGWFVPQEWTGDTAVYVAGGNIITDAELAECLEVSQRTISNWRRRLRPDNATYALFYRDLAGMAKLLNRIDQAKEAVEGGKLSDAEKQSRLQAIEKARSNLLTHADGLSKLLFERRQKPAAIPRGPRLGPQPMGLRENRADSPFSLGMPQ